MNRILRRISSLPKFPTHRIRVLLTAVLAAGGGLASPVFGLGKLDLDLELDAYYTAYGLTVPFIQKADAEDVELGEMRTYRDMLRRALVPRYLVLEASVNPMPVAGVLIRRNARRFYQEAQASPTLNLVEALTAGFEEPYALSLFLGKVIDFSPGKRALGRSRKGYVGYLASGGNYHILSNLLVPDNWFELEAKIKGDQATEKRKMSWSFRLGSKFHNNREILGIYYLGLRRNRIDYEKTPYSFWLSSAVEYRMDLNSQGLSPVGHFVLVEKNFTIPKRKWVLSVGIGYLRQAKEKYSGTLALRRTTPESQILFRPNLKF